MSRNIPFFEMFAELQLSGELRLKLAGAELTGACIDQGIYDTRRIRKGLPLKDPKTGLHYYTSGYDYTKMNNGCDNQPRYRANESLHL